LRGPPLTGLKDKLPFAATDRDNLPLGQIHRQIRHRYRQPDLDDQGLRPPSRLIYCGRLNRLNFGAFGQHENVQLPARAY
jgi:hypothetical protein